MVFSCVIPAALAPAALALTCALKVGLVGEDERGPHGTGFSFLRLVMGVSSSSQLLAGPRLALAELVCRQRGAPAALLGRIAERNVALGREVAKSLLAVAPGQGSIMMLHMCPRTTFVY